MVWKHNYKDGYGYISGRLYPDWIGLADAEAEIRADERERIVRELELNTQSNWTKTYEQAWRSVIYHIKYGILSNSPQDPKPLEKIEAGVYTDAYVINAINALVDAVNDLVRRLNEISPGNRP
jgi:hypothetical protein